MRILSSEVQQVFRAYAKQLRSDYAKGKAEQYRETRAKGFEKVEISAEAKALAANMPNMVQQQTPANKQDKVLEKRDKDPDNPEKSEEEQDTAKAMPGDSRSRNSRVEN